MKYLFKHLLIIFLLSCSQAEGNDSDLLQQDVNESESYEDNADYSDGMWCAEVEYYNPNTGTRNTYDLNVEVENRELVQINWPGGGWLDESHFIAEDISDGECSFTSDRGYQYTVTLVEKGGCRFDDVNRLKRQIEEDTRSVTCPQCNGEKSTYDELCSDCQDEAETCPKCYGYKMEWEKICSTCEDELEEEKEEDFK